MSEASQAAIKAAESLGVDLATVEGTGNNGLVTKGDVEAAAEQHAQTNIMDKQRLERHKAEQAPGLDSAVAKAEESGGIILPSQEELVAIIQELQGEVTQLREAQAGLIERESHSRDLTDEMYFIAKPNGHRWEERRVVDGKTVNIEFTGTAFYGPFESEEDIEKYLNAKKKKRADSYIDWETVNIMDGRAARALDREETAGREAQFASQAPVNVLDRRIFAQQTQGHVPGVGQAVESADKAGAAPFGFASGRAAG